MTLDTAQTITGTKTFNAPTNISGTEQTTMKLKTSNGGAIIFGKEGPNSGSMIRLDQVDGTCRLRFRSSATAGAMVWEQPEDGARLYMDFGSGTSKYRVSSPTKAGTLAVTSDIPNVSNLIAKTGANDISGNLEWASGQTDKWLLPYLLAFKNADTGSTPTYPYTGFYQWGNEWQVNARNSSNTFVHNLLTINNETKVATFFARPTVNGSGLALQSEIPSNIVTEQTDVDMVNHGNEITLVPNAFSGDVYLNYRTKGGTNGNITGYMLGNGKGGTLGRAVHSGNFSLSGTTLTISI